MLGVAKVRRTWSCPHRAQIAAGSKRKQAFTQCGKARQKGIWNSRARTSHLGEEAAGEKATQKLRTKAGGGRSQENNKGSGVPGRGYRAVRNRSEQDLVIPRTGLQKVRVAGERSTEQSFKGWG